MVAKEKELELQRTMSLEREQAAIRECGREQAQVLALTSRNRFDSRVQHPHTQPHVIAQTPLPPRLVPFHTPPLPHLPIQMQHRPLQQQPSVTNAVPVAARAIPTISPHQLHVEPQPRHSFEPTPPRCENWELQERTYLLLRQQQQPSLCANSPLLPLWRRQTQRRLRVRSQTPLTNWPTARCSMQYTVYLATILIASPCPMCWSVARARVAHTSLPQNSNTVVRPWPLRLR